MARSLDRRPGRGRQGLLKTRGNRRELVGRVTPGDHVEVSREIERIWDAIGKNSRTPTPTASSIIRGPYNVTWQDDLTAGYVLGTNEGKPLTLAVGDIIWDAFITVHTRFYPSSGGYFKLQLYVGATQWLTGNFSEYLTAAYADDESGSIAIGDGNGGIQQMLVLGGSGGYDRVATPVLEAGTMSIKKNTFTTLTTGDIDVYVLMGTPVL